MKILALSGSLRTGSLNTKLLDFSVPLLRERKVEVDVYDFKAAKIPIYDPDVHEGQPCEGVLNFKTRLKAANGLLIVSPEYNYSIPGSLKNLIDAASRPPKENPFKGKVCAQMGVTAGTKGTLQLQIMLRHVMVGLGCLSVPGAFTVSSGNEAFDEAGALKDEHEKKTLWAFLDSFVEELKAHVR